jgi:hypothetical protein
MRSAEGKLEYNRAYRKANREKILERQRLWVKAHPEKIRQYNQSWRDKHPEVKRANTLRYYYRNREKSNARSLRYSQSKIGWLRFIKQEYGLSEEQYDALVLESCGRCGVCGKNFEGAGRSHCAIDHDHATSKVRGLLCMRCNLNVAVLENKEFCLKATLYLNAHSMEKNPV